MLVGITTLAFCAYFFCGPAPVNPTDPTLPKTPFGLLVQYLPHRPSPLQQLTQLNPRLKVNLGLKAKGRLGKSRFRRLVPRRKRHTVIACNHNSREQNAPRLKPFETGKRQIFSKLKLCKAEISVQKENQQSIKHHKE
ncbi:uncharacterized protein SAPINGB_P003432 [Magnusiomyces paraingens]|uniref:Uncharacterized protein n=1 Tax=Magnusiomyces paraingens TaxID=2606893 RepID=A0A5E8BUS9_9ASCO|nr:uncharacterized protein SAPINGB_P003432 [Saprochaete ingens]VVT53157.1 unnamed protein product [Saprochaete ingens]